MIYFIEEVIDDEHVDDDHDYFMESETDDLNAALDELGQTIRRRNKAMRIKFCQSKLTNHVK